MYRIYMLVFSNGRTKPTLKCYWNKRLTNWTFDKPTVVTFLEAYWFVVNKYLCNEYKEVVLDKDDKKYLNYYYYGIEEV